jgi:UDPglucose 6-dehydrogenase
VRVCVAGLWHLGTVTAACLAAVGHDVVAFDDDESVVDDLRRGRSPVAEPGLDELLTTAALSFTTDPVEAVADAEVVWIAYDAPVDDDDRADVDWVVARARRLLEACDAQTYVVVSSQLPVGTTRLLRGERIAYIPENLQLGRAIDAFLQPARVIAGIAGESDREPIERLVGPITERIEWMSIESAEMSKHALNAFLALSVAYANELGALSERVGVDARDVARALKTDPRIGARAYVQPGAAFAGGTLARDVEYLTELSAREGISTRVLSAVRPSNDDHLQWPYRTVSSVLDRGGGATVAVWGLAYKPGTDTLRRSSALELCGALARDGVAVRAHDPAIHALPEEIAADVVLTPAPVDALDGAAALVVATPWPEFRAITADDVVAHMSTPNVIDAAGVLADTLGSDPRVRYLTVGRASR